MAKDDAQGRSDGKGKAFFDRGDQVAETGNWDFAIEMYLQGIEREPDNVDQGHKPLRDVSMKRMAQGGKPNDNLSPMMAAVGKKELTDEQIKDLVEFLKALSGEFPKE